MNGFPRLNASGPSVPGIGPRVGPEAERSKEKLAERASMYERPTLTEVFRSTLVRSRKTRLLCHLIVENDLGYGNSCRSIDR